MIISNNPKWPDSKPMWVVMREKERNSKTENTPESMRQKLRAFRQAYPWASRWQCVLAVKLSDCKTREEFEQKIENFRDQQKYVLSKIFENAWKEIPK